MPQFNKTTFLHRILLVILLVFLFQDTYPAECCGWCTSTINSAVDTLRSFFGAAPAPRVPLSTQSSIQLYQATGSAAPIITSQVGPLVSLANPPAVAPAIAPAIPPVNFGALMINVDPLPVEQCTIEHMMEV
jgi:hypothetical protein